MFKCDLARERGLTLRELDQRMDGNEMTVWQAYHNIKPIYDFYWMAAQISRTVASAMGGGKRYTIDDFLPFTTKVKPKQTPEEALAAFDRSTINLRAK
jgi:hypothetical protein